ncbi:MAG: hypothetical protein MUF42_11670 [Cytophagaceae bacterium]|jgi:hypothetical protein|nr:hypothetical protein [Cytophagaceae bacterium]
MFSRITIAVGLLLIVISSCKKHEEEAGVYYIIPSGKHETKNPLTFRLQNRISVEVKFDQSAIYQTSSDENQADINKLFGFSDCGSHHQQNSARFGWRWYKNRLEILAYCYSNGSRIEPVLIDTVAINEVHQLTLEMIKDQYLFSCNNKTVKVPRICGFKGLRYFLFPYFGGDESAPHDIRIWMKELK